MKIQEATSSEVRNLWISVESRIGRATALEDASQELATAIHTRFDESVVLARVYLAVPYGALPEASKNFVRALADSSGAASELKETTPVLALVGTHGEEVSWNDRHNSIGHKGIPLISTSYVDAIPMISRLLRELGVPVEWADTHDAEFIKKMGSGLFYVENAAKATDQKGRKIIPAQEFVAAYKVKSVFGSGGAYANGQMVVVVVFCRDLVSRDIAERFMTLIDLFRTKTAPLSESRAIFSRG